MSAIWTDLRLFLRTLRRQALFRSVSVLSLAVGIGSAAVVFAVDQAVLLRPLPYPHLQRLAAVKSTRLEGAGGTAGSPEVSRQEFFLWEENSKAFERLGALGSFAPQRFTDDDPQAVRSASASTDLFRVLGIDRLQGRAFQPEEGQPGAPKVVVISHGLWQRRFHGSPKVLGRFLDLDNERYQVVGILPAGFHFLYHQIDVWVPMAPEMVSPRGLRARDLFVVGRLRPQATFAQAQAELEALEQQLPTTEQSRRSASVQPLQDYYSTSRQGAGTVRSVLWILIGVTGTVLLIACANAGTLALVRGLARRSEVAVRRALGASHWRIARSFLVESSLLGLAGGAAGVFLAGWAGPLVIAASPYDLDRFSPEISLLTVAFVLGTSLATGLLAGAIPAMLFSKTPLSPGSALSDSYISSERHSLSIFRLLVVAEVALALMLLIGAGLMLNSLLRLSAEDPGFKPAGLWLVDLELPEFRYLYRDGSSPGSLTQITPRFDLFLADGARALRGVAGVQTVTITTDWMSDIGFRFHFLGQTQSALPLSCTLRPVTLNFFRVVGVPLIEGRSFTAEDSSKAPPVAILDQRAYPRFWPGGEALGAEIVVQGLGSEPRRVVGVVKETRQRGVDAVRGCSIYVPFSQLPSRSEGDWRLHINFVVRAGAAPPDPPALRTAVLQADPLAHPVVNVRSMEEILADQHAERRFYLLVLGTFAWIAIVLSISGVYAVLAMAVRQRFREFGIRSALGANRAALFSLAIRSGLRVTFAGCVLGVLGAYGLSSFLAGQLYGITSTDPLTFALAVALVIAAALLAICLPARRASRIDPNRVLRSL